MFSFRGHTRFDMLQWGCVVLFGTAAFCSWHWPWQVVVPICAVFGVPAMNRVCNGVEAEERAKQKRQQEQESEGE